MDRGAIATTDVFISHVEENYTVTLAVADALETAGYSVWFYERDSDGGPSYLIQTREAIVSSRAMVLIVSKASLASVQITKEIVRAHESGKPIVPLLVDVTDAEYKRRQPEWEEAVGAATSLTIPPGGAVGVMPRVLRGLEKLGVKPSVGRPYQSAPVSRAPDEKKESRAESSQTPAGQSSVSTAVRTTGSGRLVFATGAGAFTLLAALFNLSRALDPTPVLVDAALYSALPGVQIWNVIANGINLLLDAVLLNGCLQAYQGTKRGFHLVRRASGGMLIMTGVWVAMVLLSGLTSPNWPLFKPADQSAFIAGTVAAGCMAALLSGTVLYLFRPNA